MQALDRSALLAATAIPREAVPLPELGGVVYVRGMTGSERDAFEVSLVQGRGRKREVNLRNLRAKLVAYCTVDAQGVRLFTDADVEQLGQVRADVVNRIYTVAQRLSGITEEDADELGQPSSPASGGILSIVSPANSA